MIKLKSWLGAERGRATSLAAHLGVSLGRISQMADDGVPPKYMLSVRDFTAGAVSLESMVEARTPQAAVIPPVDEGGKGNQSAAPDITTINLDATDQERRDRERRDAERRERERRAAEVKAGNPDSI